jgi:hypothetical protein
MTKQIKKTQPVAEWPLAPKNETSEKAALACMLSEADPLSVDLTESHFFYPDHQLVFRAIKKLANDGNPVNIITVRAFLESKGELENAGGDPSRFFEYGGGGNACLAYYYDHLEQARSNRMVYMHIREKLEDLAKLRIDAGDFVSELLQLVYNNNEQQ